MSTANINLNKFYFDYKVLTRIIGKPNFIHLHELFRELKANTAAVPFTLRGGTNGYLGILVSATQYEIVAPETPFTAPFMPTTLLIDPVGTQYQIDIANTQYNTDLREYQTYILMQRALISLVQQVIDNKYTNAIHNRVTGQLSSDI